MSHKQTLMVLMAAGGVFLLAASANALVMNGDFSSGLNDWTTIGDVEVDGEEVVFGDNGKTYSALYQGIALAYGTYVISFDFRNELSGVVPDGAFPDTVFNSIYFVHDMSSFDLSGLDYYAAIPIFDIDYTGVYNNLGNLSSSDKGDDWTHFSMMFTNSYAYAVPTFELIDINFINNDSDFFIDNVSVTVVPEPGTVFLLGIGLAGIGAAIRRKKNKQ